MQQRAAVGLLVIVLVEQLGQQQVGVMLVEFRYYFFTVFRLVVAFGVASTSFRQSS